MKGKVARFLLLAVATLVVTMAPSKAAASRCSTASTAGDCAYTYTGTIFTADGPVPAASVGHFHGDAEGNLSGSQARSVAGSPGLEDISGTVHVNRDCTATATINVLVNGEPQRTAGLALAYDNNGNHAHGIFQSLVLTDGTNIPVVLTIDADRVFPKD